MLEHEALLMFAEGFLVTFQGISTELEVRWRNHNVDHAFSGIAKTLFEICESMANTVKT